MPQPDASGEVDIAAPAEQVRALLTDVTSFTEVIAETERIRFKTGSGFAVGTVFVGTNSNGKRRWSTQCRVTDLDDGCFAFDVTHTGIPVSRWQYDIVPTEGGCRVSEQMWDRRPGWFRKPAELFTGSKDRIGSNRRNIDATLQRLKAKAEQG